MFNKWPRKKMESCFAAFLNSLCALCPNIYPHYEEYMWCFSKLVSWKDREPGSVAETSGCPKYNLPISQVPVLPQGSCLSEYSTVHPLLTQDTRHPSSSLPSLSPDSHSTPMCWDGSGGQGGDGPQLLFIFTLATCLHHHSFPHQSNPGCHHLLLGCL